MEDKQASSSRSVERAMNILECFLDKQEYILLEIAEKTQLSPSTVLRILSALQEHDFVVKNVKSKTYHLGSKISWLAEMIPSKSYDELRSVAYPYMLKINQKYNEDVHLFVHDGKSKLCIEAIDSRRELRQVIRIGSRHDLLRGAAGKIIIAHLSSQMRRQCLGEMDVDDAFYDEIRSVGIALSDGEREEGLFGIAVPVLDSEGQILGALTLSGPSVRFKTESLETMKADMKKAGADISAICQNR
ncbi:MAG: IclR family transcriptional regulator [Lachnospiraceae bacterium]|nr:IclR family transcriptional regulator [Lachnospiraceae bacterium]